MSNEHVGKGRSAVVYLAHNQQGRKIARKIFTGDSASKLVLYLLTGTANPYTWCEAAMACAVIRRRVLTLLTQVWFAERLRIPDHEGWGWNKQHRAFELRSELINGRHAPLRFPGDTREVDYYSELVEGVMKPLQKHLAKAGFDGLVWQAGKGNPVASNNFMLEYNQQRDLHWVWIDLESGVPSLFALNPIATLGFYLPRSLHHRRWLFDDVDTDKLHAYITDHRDQIAMVFDTQACEGLLSDVAELEIEQARWRSLKRYQRMIAYEQSQGRLNHGKAQWFRSHPIRWYLYFMPRAIKRVITAIRNGALRLGHWFKSFAYRKTARRTMRYIVSSRYRWGVARWLVGRSVNSWVQRGFVDPSTAGGLRHELKQNEASGYLTDFSVHILIKPLVKVIQWILLPAMLLSGLISELMFAFLLIMGGPIARTIYTAGRTIQAAFARQRLPWTALLFGLLPMAGNAAYPVQLLHSGTEHSGALARFIVYDVTARIGRAIPVWGGADTRVEHVFNRACDVTVRALAKVV